MVVKLTRQQYIKKYINKRYRTDSKFRKEAKLRSRVRVKALNILGQIHNDELKKIMKKLYKELDY